MSELEVGEAEEVLALLVVGLQLVGRLQLRASVLQLPGLQQLAAPVEERQEGVVSTGPRNHCHEECPAELELAEACSCCLYLKYSATTLRT